MLAKLVYLVFVASEAEEHIAVMSSFVSQWLTILSFAISVCFVATRLCSLTNVTDKNIYLKEKYILNVICYDVTSKINVYNITSYCIHGTWLPPLANICKESIKKRDNSKDFYEWLGISDELEQGREILKSFQKSYRNRFKRSPNVGKFEALKRHELIDKKISEGILETIIDPNTPGVVRVHPGGKAFLLCRVENLGTNSVMWFIGDKVLSIDTSIFVPDKRLFLSYDSETGTWILEINKVQMRDQGNYSCQVSNKPTIRHLVSLQVIPNGKPLLPTLKKKRRRRKKNIRRGIHQDKQNLVIEELQQNLSSIWVEINELKVNLETHIKETDPQYYYDPSDHGHDHVADYQHGHQEGEHHGDHHHDYHEHGHHQEGDNYTVDAKEGGSNESGGYDQTYDHHHEYDHHHHHHADYDHHLQHERTGNAQDHHYDDHHHQDQHHGDLHHQDQHQDQHHGDHHHQDQHQEDHRGQDQYHGYHRRQDQHHQEGENDDDDNDHDQDEKDPGSQEDNSEENVDSGASNVKSSYRNDSPQSGGEEHHHEHGYHHHHQRRHHQKDFLKAKCNILPNSEVPESNVSGYITISQKKDASGPLYFKIDMKGFTVSPEEGTGYVHGFHIHENPIQEQKCSSAGPHFNPHGKTHGAPYAITRHVGDLGNIRVDDKGRFENQVVSDDQVAFFGKNSIIGRSIVVHLKADDLGLGGDEESLKTGNAGARLACCTIESINVPKPVKPVIRFNG